jgi:hypothetical protein
MLGLMMFLVQSVSYEPHNHPRTCHHDSCQKLGHPRISLHEPENSEGKAKSRFTKLSDSFMDAVIRERPEATCKPCRARQA